MKEAQEATKFYRTVFTIEVLSTDPTVADLDITEIPYEITEGNSSGMILNVKQEQVNRKHIAELLVAQDSDPDFLIPYDDDSKYDMDLVEA